MTEKGRVFIQDLGGGREGEKTKGWDSVPREDGSRPQGGRIGHDVRGVSPPPSVNLGFSLV